MNTIRAVLLISVATVAGCSTYRFDRPECAAIRWYDKTPPHCWCPDADMACTATAREAARLDRAAWMHYDAPWIGVNQWGQRGVHRGGWVHPTPEALDRLYRIQEGRHE
jgi:hypothetical protein